MTSLEAAEAAARDFANSEFEAKLGADTAGLFEDLSNANRMGESWDGRTFSANLDANAADAIGSITTANAAGEQFDGKKFSATLAGEEADFVRALAVVMAGIAGVPDRKTTVFAAEANGHASAAAQARTATAAVPDRKETVFDGKGELLFQVVSRAMAQLRLIPRLISIALVIGPDPMTGLKMINAELQKIVSPRKINIDSGDVRKAAADMNIFQRAALATGNAVGTLMNVMGNDGSMARRFGRMAAASMGAGDALMRMANAAQTTSPALGSVLASVDRGVGGLRRFGAALQTAGTNLATFGNHSGRASSTLARLTTEGSRGPSIFTRLGSAVATAGSSLAMMGATAVAAVAGMVGIATSGTQVAAMATGLVAKLGGVAGIFGTLLSVGIQVVGALVSIATTVAAVTAVITLLATAFGAVTVALTGAVAIAGALAIGFGLIGAAAVKLATDFGTVRAAAQRVEDAQVALNAARKSGDATRIAEAEKELARALNAQDVVLKKVSGSSKEYATQLQRMGSELDKLKGKFSQAFQGAATELARISADTMALARQHLPMLGKAAEQSVLMMEDGFKAAHQSSSSLKDVVGQIPPVMQNISEAAGNVGSAFISFLDVVLPLVQNWTQSLEDVTAELARWADSQAGRDAIRQFFQDVVPIAQAFWDMLVKVGGELLALAQEHGPQAAAMIDDFTSAASAAIDMASQWADEIMAIVSALMKAVEWVANLIDALGNIPGGAGKVSMGNMATNPGMAHGGDFQAFAGGGDMTGVGSSGAHFVTGPTTMSQGGETALYGEALSGENREYAFPLDGGWRFITEQPGFDADSFNLWQDLGARKGFFGEANPTPTGGSGTSPSRTGPSQVSTVSTGGRSAENGGDVSRVMHQVTHKTEGASGDGSARVERALKKHEDRIAKLLEAIWDSSEKAPERIRSAVNSYLKDSKDGRATVLAGLSREATREIFEGGL